MMQIAETAPNQTSFSQKHPACAINVKSGSDLGIVVTIEPSGLNIGTKTPDRLMGDYAVLFRGNPGQDVSIQIFSEDGTDFSGKLISFIEDLKIRMKLSHPNLLKVLNFIEQDGSVYIVREYAHGESLETILSRGPMPVGKAMPFFMSMLEFADYMHSKGLLFGAIQPSNILISADGILKITDFRIVAQDRSFANTSDDLYCLGLIFVRMLTGRVSDKLPKTHTDVWQILAANSVPPKISKIITRAISENPGRRYQNAAEFSEQLRANEKEPITQSIVAERPASIDSKEQQHPLFSRRFATVALAALAAIAIPAAILLHDKDEKNLPVKMESSKMIKIEVPFDKPAKDILDNKIEEAAAVNPESVRQVVNSAPEKIVRPGNRAITRKRTAYQTGRRWSYTQKSLPARSSSLYEERRSSSLYEQKRYSTPYEQRRPSGLNEESSEWRIRK